MTAIGLDLLSQGRTLSQRGAKQEALACFTEALRAARSAADRRTECVALNELAIVLRELGRNEEALERSEEAVDIARATGDRGTEALIRNSLGVLYAELGRSEPSITHLEEALRITRAAHERRGEYMVLKNLGWAYACTGRPEEALDHYRQALDVSRAIGDPSAEAAMLHRLAGLYLDAGRRKESLDHYQEALEAFRHVGDRQGEAVALHDLGALEADLGLREAAIRHYSKALTLSRETGDSTTESVTLHDVGVLLAQLGRPVAARDSYEAALALSRSGGDRAAEALTLTALGALDRESGRPEGALGYLRDAARVARGAGDLAGEARALDGLATVYKELGRPEEALARYEQALALRREAGDRRGEGVTLNNLGLLASELDLGAEALEWLTEALAIRREVGDRSGEGATLQNLGAQTLPGRPEEALVHFQSSLDIGREIGDPRLELGASLGLGLAYLALERHQDSLERLEPSLAIARRVGDRTGEAAALSALAMAHRAADRTEDALGCYEDALTVVEALRGEILGADMRMGYFGGAAGLVSNYVRLLVEHGQFARALQVAERGKARAFLELLAESRAQVREGVDPELLANEQRLAAELGFLNAALREQRSRPGAEEDAALIAGLEREQGEIELEHELNQAEIRRRNRRYAALTQPEAWDLGRIQERLLDERTVLLEFVLAEPQSFLFTVGHRGDCEAFPLPARSELELMVQELRESVTDPMSSSYPHGHALYLALVAPAASRIAGKRLLVVPDGVLHYLPFELLLTEPEPEPFDFAELPYLLHEHAIAYAPSASVAGLLGLEPQPQVWTKEFVAFAEPELPAGGGNLYLDAAVAHTGAGLEPLPATRDEVAELGALFEPGAGVAAVAEGASDRYDGERVTLRLKGEATKPAALGCFDPHAEAEDARFVHLATHGLLDEEKPQFSGLVLSAPPGGDPFWQTFEIFNARISAELVVLSACETGRGKVVRGEGVVGLARAFLYAGAASLCVSLWNVPSWPTARLMRGFYRRLRAPSQPESAEALRSAKRAMVSLRGPTAHPCFWAGFVLAGQFRQDHIDPSQHATSGRSSMATLTEDQLGDLVAKLEASEAEAPAVADALSRAAADLRALVEQGELDKAEARILEIWRSLESEPLVRAAIARQRFVGPARTASDREPVVLPELDQAVLTLNDYVEAILEDRDENETPS
jgi:CHAT domain-containing protein/tetratricopeptide (TPR) repeat protein